MTFLLQSIFENTSAATTGLSDFMVCIAVSLGIGLFLAWAYAFKSKHTNSFVMTLALLPAIVCVVIMMVNGNIGAGVAVAGAFSLVRFRSAPGSAKEIATIFLAMGTGLITGMGYLGYAVLFALVLGLMMVLFSFILAGKKGNENYILKITIPEDLNYTAVFEQPIRQFTRNASLMEVKTSNMGSLYKLTYEIQMKDEASQKEFIDSLRERNGNLEIAVMRAAYGQTEL